MGFIRGKMDMTSQNSMLLHPAVGSLLRFLQAKGFGARLRWVKKRGQHWALSWLGEDSHNLLENYQLERKVRRSPLVN